MSNYSNDIQMIQNIRIHSYFDVNDFFFIRNLTRLFCFGNVLLCSVLQTVNSRASIIIKTVISFYDCEWLFPSFVFQLFWCTTVFMCFSAFKHIFRNIPWTMDLPEKKKIKHQTFLLCRHFSHSLLTVDVDEMENTLTLTIPIRFTRYTTDDIPLYIVLCFFAFLRQFHLSRFFRCMFIHNFQLSTFCHTFSFGGKSFSMLTLNTCSFFLLFWSLLILSQSDKKGGQNIRFPGKTTEMLTHFNRNSYMQY